MQEEEENCEKPKKFCFDEINKGVLNRLMLSVTKRLTCTQIIVRPLTTSFTLCNVYKTAI